MSFLKSSWAFVLDFFPKPDRITHMETTIALPKFHADITATRAHDAVVKFLNNSGRKLLGFEVFEVEEDGDEEGEIFAKAKYEYKTPYGQPATITSDSVRLVALRKKPKVKGVVTALKDRAKLKSLEYSPSAADEALAYVLEELGRKFGGIPFSPQHTTEGGTKGVKPDHVERVVRKELVQYVDSSGRVCVAEEEVEEFQVTKAFDDDNRPGDKPIDLDDSDD